MPWFDENAPTLTNPSTGPWSEQYDPNMGTPATAPAGTGAGIPWAPGASQPSSSPDGYTWDPNQARFVPTGGATTGATASGPVNGDWQGWFNTLFPGDSLSPAQLVAQEAAINAAGGKVLRNAAGVAGKIQLPSGQIIDVIQGAGSGLNRKQWLTGDASGGGSLGSLGQGFGGLTAPFTGEFKLPTAAEAANMPGYQFARDEALRAVDRDAASKGTLLTGGTIKAEQDRAANLAMTGYGNLVNQSLSAFGTNRDTFYHNQDSPFSKLYNVAALGRPTTP